MSQLIEYLDYLFERTAAAISPVKLCAKLLESHTVLKLSRPQVRSGFCGIVS